MTLDQIVSGVIYLIAVFILFWLGKVAYHLTNKRINLREELVKKDNLAMATAIVGYYFGLIIALGGVLSSESAGLLIDLFEIFFYGIISIILMIISIKINDRVILSSFDNTKEIIDDQNVGTGVVEAANHIAVGMIIAGAMSGDYGGYITALTFWILGQAVLIVTGIIYRKMLPFNLHDEIEKDNVAVGVAFAGVLIAIGNIIRIGSTGDFISWEVNLTTFFGFVIFGLLLLPVLRWLTDKVLLPGEKLTDELVNQAKPNIGAGLVEAFAYIGASFLVGWVV
jgi:uncharacterized membrane protein YjfL (UPF0719 family)